MPLVRRRIILLPLGSSGDVNPFIWMGEHLREQGHDVTVVCNPYFAPAVAKAGLRHVPIGSAEQFHAFTANPKIWEPHTGTLLVMRYAGEATRRFYDTIRTEAERTPEKPVLFAPATAFGARLAREKLGLKLITVNLQPSVFRSAYEPPYLGKDLGWIRRLPVWGKRIFFAIVDWRFNRQIGPPLAVTCREEGVTPPRNPFRDWWQSPDGVVCLWPEWFSTPQPDWPERCHCTGFPLEDLARHHEMNPELEAFLAEGEPPVLFTPGTAMAHGRDFFQAALGACAVRKLRALFVTRYPEQLPADLPPTVRHFEYLPFSDVLPRCAAIVHHGGIGTTSQALAVGLPQLIMPLSHDQPDNADRIRRLGVGDWLWPEDFTAEKVSAQLEALLSSHVTRMRSRELSTRLHEDRPLEKLLKVISALLS